MTPEIKPITKYENAVDWHLKTLKNAIMSHYKNINLKQINFALMDEIQIEQTINALKILIHQCKE